MECTCALWAFRGFLQFPFGPSPRLLPRFKDIHVRLTGDSKLVVDVRQNKVLEVDGIKRCINVWLKCEL